MKKVLIITYYWPPSGGAGVQRWLKFTKYLPQFNVQPHVYTVKEGEYPSIDHSLEKDIPKEAVIVKKPIWEPYSIFKKLSGKSKDEKIQAGFISKNEKESSFQKMAVWVRGNLLIPDPRKFWIKPSVKFLKDYVKENEIDTIISSGPPHSMHLIARELKRRNNNLKWIADFRDPWTDIDFYKDLRLSNWADKKHHELEKSVLQEADEVLTVAPTLADDLAVIRKDQVGLITNGFDEDDYKSVDVVLDKKFSLVHVGSLNKDRNKHKLWDVLQEICEENPEFNNLLSIRFVGPVDISVNKDLEERSLIDKAEFVPPVAHNEVVKYQKSGRVLMLFINRSPNAKGVLTGKVFEYFAADRPILAIGPIDGDISKVFNEAGIDPVIDFDDKKALKDFVLKEFESFLSDNVDSQKVDYSKYSRKELTRELVKFL